MYESSVDVIKAAAEMGPVLPAERDGDVLQREPLTEAEVAKLAGRSAVKAAKAAVPKAPDAPKAAPKKKKLTKAQQKEKETMEAVLSDVRANLEVVKEEMVLVKSEDHIKGVPIPQFVFNKFLDRLDPISYCERVLRAHKPTSQKKLHSNQVDFIRAACNPLIRQVAALMARQCVPRGTVVLNRDGTLTPIEAHPDAWVTRASALLLRVVLADGHSVTCTVNHPVFTPDGWTPAGTLKPGNAVASVVRVDRFASGTVTRLPSTVYPRSAPLFDGLVADDDLAVAAAVLTKDWGDVEFKARVSALPPRLKSAVAGTAYRVLEGAFAERGDGVPWLVVNALTREQSWLFVDAVLEAHRDEETGDALLDNPVLVRVVLALAVKLGEPIRPRYLAPGVTALVRDDRPFDYGEVTPEVDGEVTAFVPVESVTYLRERAEVWDLEVPDKGWFTVGTGVKVHNSGKCHAEGTEVVLENGTLKRVEDLRPGDRLYPVDRGSTVVIGASTSPEPRDAVTLCFGEGAMREVTVAPETRVSVYLNSGRSTLMARDLLSRSKPGVTAVPCKAQLTVLELDGDDSTEVLAEADVPLAVTDGRLVVAAETKVVTSGYRHAAARDLTPGAALLTTPRGPTVVTSVVSGTGQLYEVVPVDGYEPFTVNAEHLLSCLGSSLGEHVLVTAEDYCLNGREGLQGWRCGVEFPARPVDVPPREFGKRLAEALVDPDPRWSLAVPPEYTFNSARVRLELLEGFVEAYGLTLTPEKAVDLIVDHPRLRADVLRLARSVGVHAVVADNRLLLSANKGVAKTFDFTVVPKGRGRYYGFTLNAESNRLYLLGDYTVTHNTESISSVCGYLLDNYPQMRIGIFTPRLQQAELDVGRLANFYQMNEELLNNRITKIKKSRVELDNGSYVDAVSGSDQSNIEGLTYDVIILDEAQKISDYTWSERIAPVGGATNAKLIKVGTPKTRNHFWDSVEGPGSGGWWVVRRDWTQCEQLWKLGAVYLPDPETGKKRPYSKYVLERQMPKALKEQMFPNNPEVWTDGNMSIQDFKTQYMLEFIDGAGKYLTSEQLESLHDGDFEWLDRGRLGERYVAGIDFAGANPEGDRTHVTVLRVNPDGTKHKVFAKEFNDATYPQQMYEISRLFGGYAPVFEVSKIFADYTGCGAAVVQTLVEEFGLKQIEGIVFSQRDRYTNSGMNVKNIMYAKLMTELDSGRFKYPTLDKFLKSPATTAGPDNVGFYHRMVGEWSDLEVGVGLSVNKRIEAPRGYHDDCCDADVLANFATVVRSRTMPRGSSAKVYRY